MQSTRIFEFYNYHPILCGLFRNYNIYLFITFDIDIQFLIIRITEFAIISILQISFAGICTHLSVRHVTTLLTSMSTSAFRLLVIVVLWPTCCHCAPVFMSRTRLTYPETTSKSMIENPNTIILIHDYINTLLIHVWIVLTA